MPHILMPQRGKVKEIKGDPLAAMLAAQMFAGSHFRRGMPRPAPKYALLQSDAFEQLDETNRAHVTAVLRDRAKKLGCPVSDLGWALSSRKMNGLHAVLVQKWEEIERRQWEEKKGI